MIKELRRIKKEEGDLEVYNFGPGGMYPYSKMRIAATNIRVLRGKERKLHPCNNWDDESLRGERVLQV